MGMNDLIDNPMKSDFYIFDVNYSHWVFSLLNDIKQLNQEHVLKYLLCYPDNQTH